jgi:hypothetical protein
MCYCKGKAYTETELPTSVRHSAPPLATNHMVGTELG